ncbi:MAG: hypothetical protein H0W08_19005 [Acidobacteria bacterium]|nr:hypothetical protein [Acidobacteriota bacterium]
MTSDDRAQLVEDIRTSGNKRRDIAERAALSEDFDIAAAWEVLTELEDSIEKRVVTARVKDESGSTRNSP